MSNINFSHRLFNPLLIACLIMVSILIGIGVGAGYITLSMLILLFLAIVFTVLIFRSPYIGLVVLVSLVPTVQILPDIPFFSSFLMVIGGVTLVSQIMQSIALHKRFHLTSKWMYLLTALLIIIMLIGQLRLSVAVDRNFFLTFSQLGILIFLCDQLINSKRKLEMLMLIYILAVQISALSGFFAYLGNLNSLLPYEFRPRGLVGNANGLGIHLSVSMVMAYYFIRNHDSRPIKFLLVLSFIFSGVMLFISGSRGALLFYIPVFLYQVLNDQKSGRLKIILLILLVAVLAVNFLPTKYLDRMSQIPASLMGATDTVGLRLNIWKVAIDLWKQSPVLGIGPGMFYVLTNQNYSLLDRSGLAVHNMYITFLTENGIIGLVIYLSIVFTSLILYFKTISLAKRIDPTWVAMAVTWLSALFIQLLNGTKANGSYDKIQWLCLGMSLVLWRLVTGITRLKDHSRTEKQEEISSNLSKEKYLK